MPTGTESDDELASPEPGSFTVFYRGHVEDLVAFFMRRTRNAELPYGRSHRSGAERWPWPCRRGDRVTPAWAPARRPGRVQEAWLRLECADAEAIENLDGWPTTVVARLALDRLRSARAP